MWQRSVISAVSFHPRRCCAVVRRERRQAGLPSPGAPARQVWGAGGAGGAVRHGANHACRRVSEDCGLSEGGDCGKGALNTCNTSLLWTFFNNTSLSCNIQHPFFTKSSMNGCRLTRFCKRIIKSLCESLHKRVFLTLVLRLLSERLDLFDLAVVSSVTKASWRCSAFSCQPWIKLMDELFELFGCGSSDAFV